MWSYKVLHPFLVTAAGIGAVTCSLSQPQQRLPEHPVTSAVTFMTSLPAVGAPVIIAQILIDNQTIPLNSPLAVSGNWVSRVHIVVRNTSHRPIVAGNATLVFPETGDGTPAAPLIGVGMNLGRPPASAFRRRDGSSFSLPDSYAKQDSLLVLPGETMEFHSVIYANGAVSGDDEQKSAYKTAGSISRVRIDLTNFYFADGSKWTGSSYLEPADAPALWKEIPADQFLSKSQVTY